MFCPNCRNQTDSDGLCGACGAGADSRPTLFGQGAPPGHYCANCGARKIGPGWNSCGVCGATTAEGLAVFAAAMAALLVLFGAAMALCMPRYSPPPPQPILYRTVPVPVEEPTMVIRTSVFSPSQDRWEMTSITETPAGTEITRSVGAISPGPQNSAAPAASEESAPSADEDASADDAGPSVNAGPAESQTPAAAPAFRMEVAAPAIQVSTYNQ